MYFFLNQFKTPNMEHLNMDKNLNDGWEPIWVQNSRISWVKETLGDQYANF